MNDRRVSISPEVFASYLKSRGWAPTATWRGMYVWEQGEPDGGRLLIPVEDESGTSQLLMERALSALAAAEDRPIDRLLADLETPAADTQTFRLFPSTPSGTIPLTEGRRAIDAIYELLRDAGRNRIEGHELFYQHRAGDEVYQFLDRVQLGPTAPGSYIFTTKTLGSRNAETDRQGTLFGLDEVVEPEPLPDRDIALRLKQAVFKAYAVARNLSERRAIGDPSEAGLSGNFCQALGNLGGARRDHPFVIDFHWGVGVHRQESDELPLHFTDQMAGSIYRFGVELEQLAKSGTASIEGTVIGLFAEASGLRRRVQIKGRLTPGERQNDDRTIWAFVTDSDYDRAIDAHRADRRVRAQGELRLESTGLRLYLAPDGFEVLDD